MDFYAHMEKASQKGQMINSLTERYTRSGSLWENMIPNWVSEKNEHITPDPNSNPILYYIKWLVVGDDGSGKN